MPTWMTGAARRLRALLRPDQLDAELADEIWLHIELETEELMRTRGLAREEARRQAMVAFGGVERYRESQRDARGVRWIEQLAQDVRFGARSLRKSPGFAITAMATIALGIAVSTAMYSVVHRLIIDPLPFADASRWRVFAEAWKVDGQLRSSLGTEDAVDWARRATTLETMSIVHENGGLLVAADHSVGVYGEDVQATLLAQMGVRPIVGRLFTRADATSNTDRVMVLSARFWKREFGGSAAVVGTRITLRDTSYTIVGVVPDRLNAIANYDRVDYWAPLAPAEEARFARQQSA